MPGQKHKLEEIIGKPREVVIALTKQYERYGYRRITALLHDPG